MSANVFQIMKREEGLLQDGSISTVQCPSIVQDSLIHPGINPYDRCVFRSTKRKNAILESLVPLFVLLAQGSVTVSHKCLHHAWKHLISSRCIIFREVATDTTLEEDGDV